MNNDLAVGKTLCWKGDGFLFDNLSLMISACEASWRRRKWKPWHMAKIVSYDPVLGWMVLEATWPRVRLMPLNTLVQIYGGDYRVYDWFDGVVLNQSRVDGFVKDRLGTKYDVIVYPLTIIQYFSWRWFRLPLPRLVDSAYTCWELAEDFDEYMGKPWQGTHNRLHRYPFMPDFLNEVEAIPGVDAATVFNLVSAVTALIEAVKSVWPYLVKTWTAVKEFWTKLWEKNK
jgi:hypothetical protein